MSSHASQKRKIGPTLFLKIAVTGIALATLFVDVVFAYVSMEPDDTGMYRPVLIGMILTSLPFLLGLFEAFKLLQYIDRNMAFSAMSVSALNKIKNYAYLIGLIYFLGLPYFYYCAELDDAPGVIVIGLLFTAAPTFVGVVSATLQMLLRNAIKLQSENELTI
jgi:hypothetical protein